MEPLSIFIGLTIGALVGWSLASSRARAAQDALQRENTELQKGLATAQATAQSGELSMVRDQEQHEKNLKQMKETFESLANQVLEKSQKGLLDAAGQRMKPLTDELEKLQKETKLIEEKRNKAYGSIKTELDALKGATLQLQQHSTALTTALRGSSKARGDFGEMALRNIVELAGMTQHCDFDEQAQTEDGRRPDLVIKMPGKGCIPVDAKFPLAAYQDAHATEDPKERAELLGRHARDMREHVRELKRRDYASQLPGEIDFTVMFLPGDHLLAAAFEVRPELQEEALSDRILIATPVTLVALLRTIGLYWRQHDLAVGAQDIQRAAEELHDRIKTFANHLKKTGNHLDSARKAYNDAIGSYEGRVLPAGRKLEGLNATRKDELPGISTVEGSIRALKSERGLEESAD
ncbi:MAG: DNA recombination protein RmuC [Planctomycetota bacterium]|jgi:DNA recombination protein RmuC|nr:DNA recombination protein RmuC [Planctomycetota bacterium]